MGEKSEATRLRGMEEWKIEGLLERDRPPPRGGPARAPTRQPDPYPQSELNEANAPNLSVIYRPVADDSKPKLSDTLVGASGANATPPLQAGPLL